MNIQQEIKEFIDKTIIPIYSNFDRGHDERHGQRVISRGITYATELNDPTIDLTMVYVVCGYHDVGLQFGRKNHGVDSARILRNEPFIQERFTCGEIDIMADAIEDHRSGVKFPRTIYGKIVSDADWETEPSEVIYRLWGYRVDNFPDTTFDWKFRDMVDFINQMYDPAIRRVDFVLDIPSTRRILPLLREELLHNERNVAKILLTHISNDSSYTNEEIADFTLKYL